MTNSKGTKMILLINTNNTKYVYLNKISVTQALWPYVNDEKMQ